MASNITSNNSILNILATYPDGISIEGLDIALNEINIRLNRRTLQRRLAAMAVQQQIEAIGKGRATKYRAVSEAIKVPNQQHVTDNSIPLSADSLAVQSIVNKPLAQRVPVGYQREFLERYQPNQTSYLSAEEQALLAKIGKTTGDDSPAGTYASNILERLLIDLSWNSSRLEGNTYSILETERLLSLGEAVEGKSAVDAQMILNHKDAIEFLVGSADDIGFNRYTVLNLHALLANNLLPDPEAPGRLRFIQVGIGGSVFEPLGIPQQISDDFDLILAKAAAIENPFEQAFFAMVHLPYLQPFDDVNKRVSRLSVNIPLFKNNLAPLSFVDLPGSAYIQGILGVYELNQTALLKDVFLWAYERSAARYAAIKQNIGEPNPVRLKYRQQMQEVIREIVNNRLRHQGAMESIASAANNIPEVDRAAFIEFVETDLLGLRESNCARYQITLRAFQQWQEQQQKL